MTKTTLPSRWIVRGLAAAALLTLAAGCTTVYVPRYADQGVYYDEPRGAGYGAHPADSPSYGYDRAWAVNPVHYPYWSLDYFYFSTYYHPYSVVVGSWDPYYYPYPGWRYAPRYRYGGGFGVSIAFGDPWYGYPWHGYGWGWRPVHYGYFGSAWYGYGRGYGHGYRDGYDYGRHDYNDRHPVYRNNDRMRALQRRETAAARNVLISQRSGRLSGARYVPDYNGPAGRGIQPHKRGELRRSELQSRGRGTDVSRIERRASASSNRSGRVRDLSRGSRIQSRSTTTAPRRSAPSRIESRRIEAAPRTESIRQRAAPRSAVRQRSSTRASAPQNHSRAVQRRAAPSRAPRVEAGNRAPRAPREVIRSRSIRSSAPPVRRAPAPSSNRAIRSLRAAPSRSRSEAPRSSRPRVSAPRPAVRSAPSRPAPRAQSRAPSRSQFRAPQRSPSRAAPSRSSGGRDRLRSRRGSGDGAR